MTKEDQKVRDTDVPERYQFASSTLSLNPVRRGDILDEFPPLDDAAVWCASRIGNRTTQEFSNGGEYTDGFLAAVLKTLDAIFNQNLEVPFIWHYRRDSLRQLSDDGNRKIYLHRDELWTLYDLGLKYKAVYQRREHVNKLYEAMRNLDPSFSDLYFEVHVLALPKGTAIQSVEAANEALAWLEIKHSDLAERAKEMEFHSTDRKRAGGGGKKYVRQGKIAEMLPVSRENYGFEVRLLTSVSHSSFTVSTRVEWSKNSSLGQAMSQSRKTAISIHTNWLSNTQNPWRESQKLKTL